MNRELTMSEILTDPLVHLLLKADRILPGDFADVVHAAAARLASQREMSAGETLHVDAGLANRFSAHFLPFPA